MTNQKIVVIVSSGTEWRVVKGIFAIEAPQESALGQWFVVDLDLENEAKSVLFFHGGWGKIAAAASAQYVIDRWSPKLVVNLGTCGGFAGQIKRGAIILAERTIVYDIIEQIAAYQVGIEQFTTNIDLSWLGEDYPSPVRRGLLVSADRDLRAKDIPWLKREFGAIAGDWESGAIAWVATRNQIKCLILRGVSDLVSAEGGEAYEGNKDVFVAGAQTVMTHLTKVLPRWLARADL